MPVWEMRKCTECGNEFPFKPIKSQPGYKGLYCSRTCSNRATKPMRGRRGPDNPNWKGGHVSKEGYRQIRVDGRLVFEHRVVMEQHLGRPLLPEETVHHVNGDKLDNRVENLELWSSRHPRGRRVEDLLAFADEVIALYRG